MICGLRWKPASLAYRFDPHTRAQMGQHAVLTARRPGGTHPPPVQDQPHRERRPLCSGEEALELRRYLFGIIVASETEASRQTPHVRVHDNPRGDAEALAEDDLGCLTPDTGQRNEGIEIGRYLAAVFFRDDFCSGAQRRSLSAEHSGRPDHLFQLVLTGTRQVGWTRPTTEQHGGHLIDTLIGALRREYGGYQQLPRRSMDELGLGAGVLAGQKLDNSCSALVWVHDQYLKEEPPMNSRMIEV